MTESSPHQLRVALISFMAGASGAGLLVWAIVGSLHAIAEGYFNMYIGYAVVLFLPSLFAGMVAALGAIATMKLAPRYSRLPEAVWAGLGALAAYGIAAHAAMWVLTQGIFPIWVPLCRPPFSVLSQPRPYISGDAMSCRRAIAALSSAMTQA